MDVVSHGDEGLPVVSLEDDTDCKCWSPKRSEEICMCNYALQDMSTGDVKNTNRSPGLQHRNTLSRRVLIQQLKELLNRSDLILQNSIRLQILSQNLLQNSLRLQDLCVVAEDSESMTEEIESKSEGKNSIPQQNDSWTENYTAIVQDNGSMTEETSLGNRSG